MRKKRIIVITTLVCVIVLSVIGMLYVKKQYDNREFIYTKLEDGTLELAKYQGEDLIVIIPEEVNGKKVTSIGERVFHSSPNGLQVYIPDTIIYIGERAFGKVADLTITGGKNIEVINEGAFSGCIFASEFSFSDKLRYIGDFAFFETKGMGKIEFPITLESIGDAAFSHSDCVISDMPDGLEYIGNGALYNNNWLEEQKGYVIVGKNILIKFPEYEEIIIPEGVKLVSISDVYENENIKEIYISNSVEGIVEYILSNTEIEIRIYIPSSVKKIGGYYNDELTNLICKEEDMAKVTLVVESGSYAEEYAKQKAEEYGTKYEVVDKIEYPKESENK